MDFSDEKTDGKVQIKCDSDGEVTFIYQHDDYFYRPTSLYFLNYLEFFAFLKKLPRKEKNNGPKDVKVTSHWTFKNIIHKLIHIN